MKSLLILLALFISCSAQDDNCDFQDKNLTDIDIKAKLIADKQCLVIDLSCNNLESIDPDIFESQKGLFRLKLDKNPRFQFQKKRTFMKSVSLEYFSCQNCGIETIYKETFTEVSNISLIDLSSNRIETIENGAFDAVIKLETLILKNNSLDFTSVVPKMIAGLKKLMVLDLSNNPSLQLTVNRSLLESDSLKEFNLEGCGIVKIFQKSFVNLPRLKILNLKDNMIKFIDLNGFQNNRKLKSLSLEHNEIRQLPIAIIESMESLEKLCLDQNPFVENADTLRLLEHYKAKQFHEKNICENQNETLRFGYKLETVGISDAFIGSYIVLNLFVQGAIGVLLVMYLIKIYKTEQNDSYAELSRSIVNESRIYDQCKRH